MSYNDSVMSLDVILEDIVVINGRIALINIRLDMSGLLLRNLFSLDSKAA